MINIYVKKQEDSQYLEDVKLEPADGYTQKVALNSDQLWKMVNFPQQCFLDENGGVVVPNQIPATETQESIGQLKLDYNNIAEQLNEANQTNENLKQQLQNAQANSQKDDADKEKMQQQINGQQMIINFFSKKLNEVGANVQQLMDDAKKQNNQETGGQK